MKKNNVRELIQPGEFKDHLTEVLRQGARDLVLQAVEAEFASFLKKIRRGLQAGCTARPFARE